MKPYLLFMTNLPTAPLKGQNPRGDATTQKFDALADAQSSAEKEKNNWDWVVVYKRQKEGALKKIEQFTKGRKYDRNGRASRLALIKKTRGGTT